MIWQSDDQRIDGFIVENPAEVRVRRNLFSAIFKWPRLALKKGLVDIAECDNVYTRNFSQPPNKLMPSPTHPADRFGVPHAYYGKMDLLIGAFALGLAP